MQNQKIAVIGSGLGGFGAAHRLRAEGIEAVFTRRTITMADTPPRTTWVDSFSRGSSRFVYQRGADTSDFLGQRERAIRKRRCKGQQLLARVLDQAPGDHQSLWVAAGVNVRILQDFIGGRIGFGRDQELRRVARWPVTDAHMRKRSQCNIPENTTQRTPPI